MVVVLAIRQAVRLSSNLFFYSNSTISFISAYISYHPREFFIFGKCNMSLVSCHQQKITMVYRTPHYQLLASYEFAENKKIHMQYRYTKKCVFHMERTKIKQCTSVSIGTLGNFFSHDLCISLFFAPLFLGSNHKVVSVDDFATVSQFKGLLRGEYII